MASIKAMERCDSMDEENDKQTREECIKNLDDATKEWDEVQEIIPSFANEMDNRGVLTDNKTINPYQDTALVSVAQVIEDFRNQDLTIQRSEVEVSVIFFFKKYHNDL